MDRDGPDGKIEQHHIIGPHIQRVQPGSIARHFALTCINVFIKFNLRLSLVE